MNILITGASSGIGRQLAIEYAKTGANLFLCARNMETLQETKQICKEFLSSANIFLKELDVRDKEACTQWIASIEANYEIDLIIANAGISAGTSNGLESDKQIRVIFDTNLYGVLNIINPAIEQD